MQGKPPRGRTATATATAHGYTTDTRIAAPIRRQTAPPPEYASAVTLPRISSESVKKMALAQRKKPFSGEPKKNGKSLLRLVALKGFSGESGIFSFQSLALASFASFLR